MSNKVSLSVNNFI